MLSVSYTDFVPATHLSNPYKCGRRADEAHPCWHIDPDHSRKVVSQPPDQSLLIFRPDIFLATNLRVPAHAPSSEIIVHHTQYSAGDIKCLGLRMQLFTCSESPVHTIDHGQEETEWVCQDNDPFRWLCKRREPLASHVRRHVIWLFEKRRVEEGAEGVLLVPRAHKTGGGDYKWAEAENGKAKGRERKGVGAMKIVGEDGTVNRRCRGRV